VARPYNLALMRTTFVAFKWLTSFCKYRQTRQTDIITYCTLCTFASTYMYSVYVCVCGCVASRL